MTLVYILALSPAPWLSAVTVVAVVALSYLGLGYLCIRRQRFRAATAIPCEPATLLEAEREVLEKGHVMLEKLGFRYAFTLKRQFAAAREPDAAECFYLHTGFDSVALLRATGDHPSITFRSYRPDGWCLESQSSESVKSLPRPPNVEAWTPTQISSPSELLQTHVATFQKRARGVAALLPEPGKLMAHEIALANDEIRRHTAKGLLAPTSGAGTEYHYARAEAWRRARNLSPAALKQLLADSGVTVRSVTSLVILLALMLALVAYFVEAKRAADSLAAAQSEFKSANAATSLEQLTDAMSPTEKRTPEQGAWWWCVAAEEAGTSPEAALAAFRLVPAAQRKAGSSPPAKAPKSASAKDLELQLHQCYALLSADLKLQQEAKNVALFQADAQATAALLRDWHWSFGQSFQAERSQHLLQLLDALEQQWQLAPPNDNEFTAALLGSLPQPDEMQRDAAAAYFLEKIKAPSQPDKAPVLAKLLRDYTPLGSSSLAGQLRCEVALWQALRNQRAWTDAMLMPATEQENNIVAQLHQQPTLAQRRVQFGLLSHYAPRRSLCVAAIATHMLMKQLPTPQMYVPPVIRALQKLSGTGPGIEIISTDPGHPLLQVTVQTMPPQLVQWKLK